MINKLEQYIDSQIEQMTDITGYLMEDHQLLNLIDCVRIVERELNDGLAVLRVAFFWDKGISEDVYNQLKKKIFSAYELNRDKLHEQFEKERI